MTALIFPGRHHLLTNFQLEYLTLVTSREPAALVDVNGRPLAHRDRIDTVIWAFGDAIVDLHRRPILTADGDLTATRDYNTYVRSCQLSVD